MPKVDGEIMAGLWGCSYREISVKEDDMKDIEKVVNLCLENTKKKRVWRWIEQYGPLFQVVFQYLSFLNTIIGLFFLFFGTIFTILQPQEKYQFGTSLFLFIMIGVSQIIISFLGIPE